MLFDFDIDFEFLVILNLYFECMNMGVLLFRLKRVIFMGIDDILFFLLCVFIVK